MASPKPAYVSGTKPNYQLCIRQYMGANDFYNINWETFPTYRAAQDIANAINDHVARKEAAAAAKKEKKPCAKKR